MKHIHIVASGFISGLVILLFSLNIITGLRGKINDLESRNMLLSTELDQLEIRRAEFNVTGTMYSPTREQCDATPNITADGTRINPKHASSYRYVALSRDLLKRWGGPFNYGEYITVEGTKLGKHDGIWQVRDTMNPKWLKRIDFLMTDGTRPFKYNEIKITKLNS
jgi:3D (Asp-Asp-Asp) domain-containing protein